MGYLARKITRAKWEDKEGISSDEIPSDAVTADLRTRDNRLSLWSCGAAGNVELERIVLALAASSDRVERVQVIWIDEDPLRRNGISIEASEGRTPIDSLRAQHRDAIHLDWGRLGIIARSCADAIAADQFQQLTQREVLTLICEAVESRVVRLGDLAEKVRLSVEQELTRRVAANAE
jgi:hypothetical protein